MPTMPIAPYSNGSSELSLETWLCALPSHEPTFIVVSMENTQLWLHQTPDQTNWGGALIGQTTYMKQVNYIMATGMHRSTS